MSQISIEPKVANVMKICLELTGQTAISASPQVGVRSVCLESNARGCCPKSGETMSNRRTPVIGVCATAVLCSRSVSGKTRSCSVGSRRWGLRSSIWPEEGSRWAALVVSRCRKTGNCALRALLKLQLPTFLPELRRLVNFDDFA